MGLADYYYYTGFIPYFYPDGFNKMKTFPKHELSPRPESLIGKAQALPVSVKVCPLVPAHANFLLPSRADHHSSGAKGVCQREEANFNTTTLPE